MAQGCGRYCGQAWAGAASRLDWLVCAMEDVSVIINVCVASSEAMKVTIIETLDDEVRTRPTGSGRNYEAADR